MGTPAKGPPEIFSSAIPALLVDVRGRVVQLNRPARRILASGMGEAAGRALDSLLTMEGGESVDGVLRSLFEGEAVQGVEAVVRAEAGDRIDLWVWGARLDTEPPSAVLMLLDVSERRREEEALRASEKRFRLLVEQAGDGFFVSDSEGRFLDVNEAACAMLGYTRPELLQMRVWDVGVDRRATASEYRRFFQHPVPGAPATIEDTIRRNDGSTIPVELRVGLLRLGEEILGLALVRDVSERKRAEEALRTAHDELEIRVEERTVELREANARLARLKAQLEQENVYLQEEIKTSHNFAEIIGESLAVRKVLKAIETVAPTDSTVLISGETGTGKELVARALHNLSEQKGKPLVKVNCAALPATLVESELFGHEKGAFTGALYSRPGRFELADRGSIFLDEIGDLSIELQAKLLRVLQEGEFERVGGSRTIQVSVRVIAAVNQDLERAVREQRFRADLYYRLNVFPIRFPPLRERKKDIPLLVEHFVAKYGRKLRKRIERVPREAMESLMGYAWPGNVRELENVIERAVILSRGSTLDLARPARSPGAVPEDSRLRTLDELQRAHILSVLETTGWRVSGKDGAARVLGIVSTTLESRMKKLGIRRPKP